MAQIKCNKISIGYDKTPNLSNLTFSVHAGDYLCIVGENGSGKSTLIKTILGLIPTVSGKIEFGENLSRREIGYLPQQTIVQRDFPATVMEVVMSGFQNRSLFRPFYSKKEKQEAKDNLKKLGIENLAKTCYRELSGGQQQRVLLARALCGAQKMLLLDEPVTGLDPLATEEMYDLIKKLNDDGVTIIMISHDINSAIKYASHILYVKENPIFDTKKNFLKSEVAQIYKNYVGGHIGGHDHE